MSQSEKYEVLKAQEEFYEKILRGEDLSVNLYLLMKKLLKRLRGS